MCQWRGGIGQDSIYAEMVSSTMYSSSDYPLIDGFTNTNIQPEEQLNQTDNILDQTLTKMIDLTALRNVIKTKEEHDHLLGMCLNRKKTKNFFNIFIYLGNQTLRDFVFNETPSGSFINTIHESYLGQIDESLNKSSINPCDDIDHHDDNYNHEELIHAAIEDLNDDPSHTNEIFRNAINELNQQEPSNIQSQQSTQV